METIGRVGWALAGLSLLGIMWLIVAVLVLGSDPAPFPLNILIVVLAGGITLVGVTQ